MGFFEGRVSWPDDEDEDEHDDLCGLDDSRAVYLGGVVPVEVLLARSDAAAVALRDIVAFPDGFELTLAVWVRAPVRRRRRGFGMGPILMEPEPLEEGEELPPELLRFGIEFPDGVSVTNLDMSSWQLSPDATEPLHGMESSGGGGSDAHYEQEWWVWPVPGPGIIWFVCEWPAYGIGETRHELDAGLIREAAERARPVWPDVVGRSHPTRWSMFRQPGLGTPDP